MELPAGRWRAIDPPSRPGPARGAAVRRRGAPHRGPGLDRRRPRTAPRRRGERRAVRVVRGRRGVLLRPASPPGAGRDPARPVHGGAARAADITTWAGAYTACHTTPNAARPLSVTLSQALQRRLGERRGAGCGRGPGGHGRARRARGRRPAGGRRAAARAAAPAPRARLHQVAPHHLSAAGAERARGRAGAGPAHPGVPDRHELGPAQLVPAAARNGRRAVGGHRAHRVLRRPAGRAR